MRLDFDIIVGFYYNGSTAAKALKGYVIVMS